MPACGYPRPAGRNANGLIQFQSFDCRSANWRRALNPESAIDPAEMAVPVVAAGIEETHHSSRDRVPCPDAIGLEIIALGTGQPEVLVLGTPPARQRDEVIKLHQFAEDR